ncbi:MAG: ImmA/IrrE family metallo-endopeptidase [Tepidiforma sp.]
MVEPLRRGTRGATMLSPDRGEWWVVLNANDRYPVRRFTLAHEAFHIACGTGLAMRRDGVGQFYECSLADHFASHQLIPRQGSPPRSFGIERWSAMRGQRWAALDPFPSRRRTTSLMRET